MGNVKGVDHVIKSKKRVGWWRWSEWQGWQQRKKNAGHRGSRQRRETRDRRIFLDRRHVINRR